MSNSLRTRLNLLIATAIAFAFGVGLASVLDLTPLSIAADGNRDPGWVIGAPAGGAMSMESGFADVAQRVAPAVVTIYLTAERETSISSASPFPPGFEPPPGFQPPPGFPWPPDSGQEPDEERRPRTVEWSGSGFIVSEAGYVVTNNHVVAGAERIDIELHDGRVFEDVELVGRDPQTDVALLRLEMDDSAVLPIGSSDETEVGEWVLAIGSPGFRASPGPLLSSVTAGIVSAKGRSISILRNRNRLAIEDFIQTDAVINRGNSGGPLVNAAGEVIGINTAILSETGTYQGYGFAVPIELAREVVDDLIEFGEVRRALIGVTITDVDAADAAFYRLERVAGAKIQTFSSDDSPARLAGLDGGDVIVGVAGQPVSGVSELQRRIRAFEPGETVTLDVVRRSTLERDRARVRLISAEDDSPPQVAARPEPPEATGDILGLEVKDDAELEAQEHDQYRIDSGFEGVAIVDRDPRGAVGRLLPEGTLILDINGEAIQGRADYDRIISGLEPGDALSLQLNVLLLDGSRRNAFRSVVIPER